MFSKLIILVACVMLKACDSAFVDTLPKCPLKDDKCLKNVIQNVLKDLSKNGIKEYNIPPIDPFEFKNIEVPILGLVNITLVEGTVAGIKECVTDIINVDIENGLANMEFTCDIIIKGKFKVFGTSPLLENLFGGNTIHGDGNVILNLDKVTTKFDFYYHVIKKDDGELYFKCHPKQFRHGFDIGNFKIFVDNIFLGNQDASGLIVEFLNQNWKFVVKAFGKNFFDTTMNYLEEILNTIFDLTPAKYFTSDDLTSYVKK